MACHERQYSETRGSLGKTARGKGRIANIFAAPLSPTKSGWGSGSADSRIYPLLANHHPVWNIDALAFTEVDSAHCGCFSQSNV